MGIDPAGAEVLARELQDAERMLIEAAAEVRAALADAGVTSFAAVELDAISTWCRAQAIDVRRRAGAIDVRGINARAAASLFAQDPEVNELRRQQLFALLGLGAQELDLRWWVAAEFPELAERRERTISAMTALGRARATVGVQAYMGGSRDGNSGERMSQLMRLERAQEQQGRATAAEMERFLAGLDDAQVRYVATALLEALATERRRDRAVDMAEALAPLRSRLRDQLAEAARQAYMGRPGRQPFDVDALAKLYKGLGFERQRPTNAFTEFLAGLFFGDFAREDGAGGAGISRTLGHLASGLFAVGDVRDTLANVSAGRWRDAALSALGAIPIVGDLAKAEDAVDGSVRAARRADDGVGGAQRGADDLAAALKGTPLEGWEAGQPLPNAAKAIVDHRKFHDYSMKEDHLQNNGKFAAFSRVGYKVNTHEGRLRAAVDVTSQVRAYLATLPPAKDPQMTHHGSRLTVDVPLRGPNGRTGTLVAVWQYDHGSDLPKLITNYLKEHR